MYHLHVNQQAFHQQEMQARVTFEQRVSDEFANIHLELSNLQITIYTFEGLLTHPSNQLGK
jgi:hypothetical protein